MKTKETRERTRTKKEKKKGERFCGAKKTKKENEGLS
jgi:hypothetical protein